MNVNNFKLLFILILAFLNVELCISQEKITEIYYYDENWKKVSKDNAKYSRIITFYEDNYTKPVGRVKDYYEESGNLQWSGYFSYYDLNDESNNKIHGIAYWYYDNGKKSRQSKYIFGKETGTSKYWHENGSIKSTVSYEDGKAEGEYLEYNENGSLVASLNYKNGKADGDYSLFYTDGFRKGKLKYLRKYENGKPISKWGYSFDEYGKCNIVFQDNFNKKNNNWKTGYGNDNNCYYDLDTINQKYSISTYSSFKFPSIINVDVNPVSEFVLETKIFLERGSSSNPYGILFGFKDWDNHMVFWINESSEKVYYKIDNFDDGIKMELTEGWRELKSHFNINNYNKIQIRQFFNDDELKIVFAVNNELITSVPFSLLKGFNFGFTVSGSNAKITADFIKFRYPCDQSLENIMKTSSCEGYGTGFAIGTNGYIATNYHVINECKDVYVLGVDGNNDFEYKADIILRDSVNDLAILKVDKKIYNIPYGIINQESSVLNKVYAYGYPKTGSLGYNIKATDGTITSLTATKNDDKRYYQHTAPIQPGNSGGPLIDVDGNIVGINTLAWLSLENVFAAVKSKILVDHMKNFYIDYPKYSNIKNQKPSDQYLRIKDYVYLIKVK